MPSLAWACLRECSSPVISSFGISQSPNMAKSLNRWTRKLHRWGAIATLLPLFLVIVTGLLLQVKKQATWVQPATVKGTGTTPEVDWQTILAVAQSVDEAEVKSWEDVDRIDVRPGKGMLKLQCKNRWELQIDSQSGALLSSTYRRSDFIESLHDGSFFADGAKLWVFLPNGLILLGLWFSGVYLWWLPIGAKRKKQQKKNRENRTTAKETK